MGNSTCYYDKPWYNPTRKLHRLDGPARITNGMSLIKEWFVNGEARNPDPIKPYVTKEYHDERWEYYQCQIGEPVILIYDNENRLKKKIFKTKEAEYYFSYNSCYQTLDIEYWSNGDKQSEKYCEYDKFHRIGGPAYIFYRGNGYSKYAGEYWENGVLIKRLEIAQLEIKQPEVKQPEVVARLENPRIEYWPNGNKREEEYWENGKRHRIEGPAWIRYHENGNKWCEQYWENNEWHRIGGPALTSYCENGNKKSEQYFKNYGFHRIGGPAWIRYYENGNKFSEDYFENSKKHRIGGPTGIWYWENGNKREEIYWENGDVYRTGGPAKICYNENGGIIKEEYYKNGLLVRSYEFKQPKIAQPEIAQPEVKQPEVKKNTKIECLICMSANAVYLMNDCHHLVYCEKCNKKGPLKCPVCRQNNTKTVKIYY